MAPHPHRSWWALIVSWLPGLRPATSKTVLLAESKPAPPARGAILTIRPPARAQQQVTLARQQMLLGRSEKACQIVVPVDSVSRIHALIRPVPPRHPLAVFGSLLRTGLGFPPARYLLLDQQSANGLYQKGRRLKQVWLHHRTRVRLGPPQDSEIVELEFLDPPPWIAYVGRGVLGLSGGLMVVVTVLAAQEWQKITVDPLPMVSRGPVLVLAADGHTLLRRNWSDAPQELPRLEQFGPLLPKVLVEAEDKRFYSHWGVDLLGIVRALWINATQGEWQQGGSSISQQLARTILREYTGTDNTLGRKLREMLAALKLEWYYPKSELLRLYLNSVYMGNGLYGFENASQFYFGKPAAQLDLPSAASLVGLLPAPNVFNPLDNEKLALRQRDWVLDKLGRSGQFSENDIRQGQRSRLVLNPDIKSLRANQAPYFYSTVLAELNDVLGSELASQGNFIVESTLRPDLQKAAEQAVLRGVQDGGSQFGFKQGALLTLDSRTGEILALVGGTDYVTTQFNRVTQAQRQPGSTFKVFAYASALEQGISPWQTFSCSALQWQMVFNGCRHSAGDLTLAQGLVQSENVVALRVAQQVGLDAVVEMAHRLGIQSPLRPYPAIVLGTMEVNMLELTRAFAVLANQGVQTHPHTIRRVRDALDCADRSQPNTCREIFPGSDDLVQAKRVLDPQVAVTMTELLQQVPIAGTGRNAYLGRGEAGKTGTTTDNKDLWFVGYLPNPAWVTAVWVGNDDSTPTRGSSAQAAAIWGSYMRTVK